MRILLIGATGFIGRALVPALQREGHHVMVSSRSAARARSRLGADIETVATTDDPAALTAAVERADAVVNLAGEPILSRWTAARRKALAESRVGVTSQLVAAIGRARTRPRVLVNGSAVGYYGNRGDAALDETATPGDGFLGELCQRWEAAATPAEAHGTRVVLLRTGVVYGREGGALAVMLPPFRLGVGGPIGSGRQFVPWIHLHDLVQVILTAIDDERYRGPLNAVAPEQVDSRTLARTLGQALRRPAILAVPAIALRAIFGSAAAVLLDSQRVEPGVLQRLAFPYRFAALGPALADVVHDAGVEIRPLSSPVQTTSPLGRAHLDAGRPTSELLTTTVVRAPLAETFEFFSKAENLGLLTPSAMQFSLDGPPPAVVENVAISYRLRIGPVPIRWRSRIVSWRPGSGFVDLQERGPYRAWWHEHTFEASGEHATVMRDRVCYALPFGLLGRPVDRLFVAPMLRRIFSYRLDVIALRFGRNEP